jgi:2-keto-4-pentenoate hydratase/2-oxohepta-3-ene-1,7-dioic acid hydratase in catechol pathway
VKLCTFEVATALGPRARFGAWSDAGVVDLNAAAAARFARRNESACYRWAAALVPDNAREFLEGGAVSLALARRLLRAPPGKGPRGERITYAPEEVRLLAPLPDPASVRDFYAFEQHVRKGFERRGEPMPQEWYEIPVYYQTGHHHILGTDHDIAWPSFTERFDYELELAAVIGKRGRNVRAAEARDYIAGFTVMNDFSARDIQRREMKVRLGPAKGKHWATALGPWLVTCDEIPDPYNLTMVARVNGEEWSRGSSGSIFWKFEQMIEFLTQDDEILPGDVIGSGTVGTGCGLELDRWVQRGDVMELEIERIGVLRNRVV